MFSRGNVKEKARVLGFGDVASERVVDMYAGIGYFAFSYAAVGASRVFCWELNEWSCEALVRGARFNGWSVAVVKGGERWVDGGERIVVFLEDNNFAGERLHGMRGVRHVNAGLLPTSRGGWGTALEIIDGELGGWIHVHENMGISEIKVKTEEVVAALIRLDSEAHHDPPRLITCSHVEQVKTFAPGVMHCVLDIHIGERNNRA